MPPERPVSAMSFIVPAVFLIGWLALCFAAFLNSLSSEGGLNWMAILIILGMGGFGAYGLGRSVVRKFLYWQNNR